MAVPIRTLPSTDSSTDGTCFGFRRVGALWGAASCNSVCGAFCAHAFCVAVQYNSTATLFFSFTLLPRHVQAPENYGLHRGTATIFLLVQTASETLPSTRKLRTPPGYGDDFSSRSNRFQDTSKHHKITDSTGVRWRFLWSITQPPEIKTSHENEQHAKRNASKPMENGNIEHANKTENHPELRAAVMLRLSFRVPTCAVFMCTPESQLYDLRRM